MNGYFLSILFQKTLFRLISYNFLFLLSFLPHWFFGKRSKLRLFLIFCCCNASHQKSITTPPLPAIIIIKATKAKMFLQILNQKYLPTSTIKFRLTNWNKEEKNVNHKIAETENEKTRIQLSPVWRKLKFCLSGYTLSLHIRVVVLTKKTNTYSFPARISWRPISC